MHSLRPIFNKNNIINLVLISLSFAWLIIVYKDIVNHEFLHWDDVIYFVSNPHLHQLSIDNLVWMLTDYSMMNWHPLTWLSHSIDFALFGNNPVLIKVVNIVLHVGNSVILYFLFLTLLELIFTMKDPEKFSRNRNVVTAILASSIYAIHPQHIESVVWIAERKDILCGLFYFSAILFYLKYRQLNEKRYFNITLICAVLATMSKPMVVSLPLTLILLDIFPLKLISKNNDFLTNIRIAFKDKTAIFLLSIFIAILTLFTQSATIKDFSDINLITRIINACIASVHYLTSVLVPVNLLPFYPFDDSALTPDVYSLIPVLVILSIIGLCILLWKQGHPLYLIAMSFFLITILPVIGIVTVGHQAYADRYAYITTSLFYLAFSQSIISVFYNPALSVSTRQLAISVTACTILSLLGFTGTGQIKNWRNDETLWLSVIQRYPNKVQQAYQILGNNSLVKGQYQDAIDYYHIALNIDPGFSKTYENLGRAYSKLGLKEQEIESYLLAIKHDDNAVWPRLLAGNFYLTNNNVTDAEPLVRQTLAIAPDSAPVVIENAKLDLVLRQAQVAKSRLKSFLTFSPNNLDVLWMLAQIYYAEGNIPQARLFVDRVIKLNPNSLPAQRLQTELTKVKTR